jgi:hypothetical protein
LVAGIVVLNSAEGMDVCPLCLFAVLSCVGTGLCDGLITRPEVSYRVYNCVWLRNLNKEENKAQAWAGCSAIGKAKPLEFSDNDVYQLL